MNTACSLVSELSYFRGYSCSPMYMIINLALPILAMLLFGTKALSPKQVIFFFVISCCALNSLRRGGGDLTHYTELLSTGSFIYYAEPFWLIIKAILASTAIIGQELQYSICLFLVSFVFLMPFIISDDSCRESAGPSFLSLLILILLFGPALPQAQIRLATSIGFGYSSFACFNKKMACYGIIFGLFSLLSHSTALIFLPLLFISNILSNGSAGKKIIALRVSFRLIFLAASLLVLGSISYGIISSRYVFSGDSSAIALGAVATTSLTKDVAWTLILIALTMLKSGSNKISIVRPRAFGRYPSPSNLLYFNLGTVILTPFGWLSRFKFWACYGLSQAISVNWGGSWISLLPLVALATIRNLLLYLANDPSQGIFINPLW
jgi:hypothetical protein